MSKTLSKASVFSKHTNSLRGLASERRDGDFESLAMVGGFSAAGLALASIAAKWLANADFSGFTLLLVLGLVPVAVALGFTLESPKR